MITLEKPNQVQQFVLTAARRLEISGLSIHFNLFLDLQESSFGQLGFTTEMQMAGVKTANTLPGQALLHLVGHSTKTSRLKRT